MQMMITHKIAGDPSLRQTLAWMWIEFINHYVRWMHLLANIVTHIQKVDMYSLSLLLPLLLRLWQIHLLFRWWYLLLLLLLLAFLLGIIIINSWPHLPHSVRHPIVLLPPTYQRDRSPGSWKLRRSTRWLTAPTRPASAFARPMFPSPVPPVIQWSSASKRLGIISTPTNSLQVIQKSSADKAPNGNSWMVSKGKSHSNGWWLGVPPLMETPKSFNLDSSWRFFPNRLRLGDAKKRKTSSSADHQNATIFQAKTSHQRVREEFAVGVSEWFEVMLQQLAAGWCNPKTYRTRWDTFWCGKNTWLTDIAIPESPTGLQI